MSIPSSGEPIIGETFTHYRILREVGSGGMGVVYEAEDLRLQRHVAVKFLPDQFSRDPEALRRFEREARAASALNHPNICVVHDVGAVESRRFIVMELMEGISLREKMNGGRLALDAVLDVGIQIADALEAAHAKGIVHRDIKPANVFVTRRGDAKLLDFGVASDMGRYMTASSADVTVAPASELTVAGSVLGTVAYMSPEQARGAAPDARTDLYSLGAMLYEMVTGVVPFGRRSPADTVAAILNEQPVPIAQLNPVAPRRLAAIITRTLEKDPERRYQSAAALKSDLKQLRSAAPQPEATAPAPATLNRRLTMGLLSGVAIALVAVGLWRGRSATTSPERTAGAGPKSLAVLPFEDLSASKDHEYFTDGLADELLNALARISELKVAGRTSSFQFKGKSTPVVEIGNRLNVAAVLEGSVRTVEGRVRISAQLVSVADGFSLWSATYDRELNDVFAVQDEIARAVSAALRVKLLGSSSASPGAAVPNPEAYTLYLQARYFSDRRSRENLAKAVDYYERALQRDPRFTRALVGLADARRAQANSGYVTLAEGYRQAREEVDRALQLDPNMAEAYAALGRGLMAYDWDWLGADAAFRRALELEPNNAVALRWAATLAATLGRLDEAIHLGQRAVEFDPLSVRTLLNLAVHCLQAGRHDESKVVLAKVLELNPDYPSVHAILARWHIATSNPTVALQEAEREREPFWRRFGFALAYAALGRTKEASAALQDLIKNDHDAWAFQIAEVYAFRGETDRVFEWLERAYTQRDAGMAEIKSEPLFAKVRSDPRFAALLKKLRVPVDG